MIDVAKTYTISGQTLMDIIDSVKDGYRGDHGTIQVGNINELLDKQQRVDWQTDFGLSSANVPTKECSNVDYAYVFQQNSLLGTISTTNIVKGNREIAYYIDGPSCTYSIYTHQNNFFQGCSSLKTVRMHAPDGYDYNGFFQGCYSLQEVIFLPNQSNIVACPDTAKQMFAGCRNLLAGPTQINFSNCEYAQELFAGCRMLSSLPAYNFEALLDAPRMFQGTYCKTQSFLNSILAMCLTMECYEGDMTLSNGSRGRPDDTTLGLSSEQISEIDTTTQLYEDFVDMGWSLT